MKLPEFELDRYFQRHAYGSLLNLCASDCEPWSVAAVVELVPRLQATLLETVLAYPQNDGVPHLRAQIAASYSNAGPEDVLVTTGAEEAIFLLMNVLVEPGTHVVVHSPCYQSLHAIASAKGARVSRWLPDEASGWQLDPDDLGRRLAEGARLVVVNSPHNPTGACIAPAIFAEIVALCRRHGARLLADEVYRGLEHSPAAQLPAAADAYELGISLGDMSKAFGMPGLRIGWLVARDAELRRAVSALKDYTTTSASVVSQQLAAAALGDGARIVALHLDRLRRHRAAFARFLEDSASWCSARLPDGGTTALLRLQRDDADEFCARARRERELLLLPASTFQFGSRHVRIGLGRERFVEGLDRLASFGLEWNLSG